MKKYELPIAEIMAICAADIITASDITTYEGDPTAAAPSSWKNLLSNQSGLQE